MGRIIAIANQKGGVGKTTTAINLSACLAEAKKKVLTIDLDPQGNTTSGLGVDKNETDNTVYELILGDAAIKECMHKTEVDNLYVLPSNVDLAGAEIELLDVNNKVLVDNVGINCIIYNKSNINVKDEIKLAYKLASNITDIQDIVVSIKNEITLTKIHLEEFVIMRI